jgi:hypothetical protein
VNRYRIHARRGLAGLSTLVLLAAVPAVAGASGSGDVRVTDHTYVSSGTAGHNDSVLRECSVARGRKNEPAVAVDPRNANVMLGSSNDYCGVFQNDADGVPQPVGPIWLGYYRSQTGGSSWTNSLVPGYPGDTSAAAATLSHIRSTSLGDPTVAWDTHGRAYFGSIGDQSDISKKAEGDINISVYENPGGGAGTSADGSKFVGSFTVQQGTPSPLFLGHFNDKVWMDVDRTGGPNDGNVYVTWTRFEGNGGTNQLFFSRSTDHGRTWSHAVKLTESAQSLQGSDIAMTNNGDVYVSFVNDHWKNDRQDAARFVKSSDGGRTWSSIRTAAVFEGYDAQDIAASGALEARELAGERDAVDSEAEAGTARDCGDDFDACASGYTFFRHDSSPRIAADQSSQGDPNTVYIVFHAIKPGSEVATGSTFGVNGSGNGGQAAAYITKTSDGGAHWSTPQLLARESYGHQIWPVVDANRGVLRVAWYDSRNDPCYSPARPIGNCAGGRTVASLDTFSRTSTNGGASWGAVTRLSTATSNPNYEMFDGRRVPFWGDYIDLSAGGDRAFAVWTDGRDIVPGSDLRFPDDGDNADVKQCRTGDLSVDFCPHAGGLDQNIYGALVP